MNEKICAELIPTRQKSYYGKAVIALDTNGTTLYSYGTPVIRIDNDCTVHRLWGGYSATSMKHINDFLYALHVEGGGKKWWDALSVEVGGANHA